MPRACYRIETRRLFKLLAGLAVAWVPAMCGIALLGTGWISPAAAVVMGLAGGVAGVGLVATRTVHRRRGGVTVEGAAAAGAPTWAQVANPRGNFANRWAMYENLTATLGVRDWSGKIVGEFGGTNEILRAFMPGAEHRLFLHPEYDLQDLREIPDGALDVAVLDQTLEHVPDAERALREVRRVLRPRGMAIVTTPFLVPVHAADTYGDYYRWTPQGLTVMLRRCGFTADVHMWGNRAAAAALLEDMYMTAEAATGRGLGISFQESDATFPVTVWALAEKTN